jgi:hypothetical protein
MFIACITKLGTIKTNETAMRKAIGIRANPNEVTYSIIEGTSDEFEVVIIDKVVNPKSLELPEQLKFIRNTFSDIINENKVNIACIRITESNARRINTSRMYIEGVIQELIASSTIENYYVGQISNISAKLGIDRSDFKPFVEGKKTFLDMDIWKDLTKEERECFLASVSTLNRD